MAIRICALLMLVSIYTGYSQNAILLKNFNPKVKELKHNLNKSRDSLSLVCESRIIKVDIFNEDYEQSLEINNFHSLIPLQDLPTGKFVVEVKLVDKIVEMHVIKQDNVKRDKDSNAEIKNLVEGNGMMLDEELKVIKNPPKNSFELLLNGAKKKQKKNKKRQFYWVVLEVNNGNNSYKSMKLVNESIAKKMISRNKLQSKNNIGKQNTLTVWEVHNSSKFMQKQVSDPSYFNSTSSDYFNVVPHYTTSTKEIIALN